MTHALRLLLYTLSGSLLLAACSGGMGRPSKGAKEELSTEQQAAIAKVRSKVDGLIAWSTSRIGNHDIFVMKTDGSAVRALTKGEHVDWYPRFSRDGARILFTRSKKGWVSEKDANRPEKWDLYTMTPQGKELKLVVKDASWGVWIGDDKVLFARGTKVLTRELAGDKEELLVDSAKVASLGGADLQNPHLSQDGKHLAITLRGARRETGIFELASKAWTKTGEGCQINWFPAGDRIIWINPSGNGGSEVFSVPVTGGKLTKEHAYEEMRYIDIPGRRSHEYFPQLDRGGKWLVWAATQRGHDHDIADYEIYIWQLGAPAAEATRLTFHSGNDRWPDIFIK